ncbi:MAG TPA: hypothetical protein VF781_05360 [Solirubrobacteraceae bacterium]
MDFEADDRPSEPDPSSSEHKTSKFTVAVLGAVAVVLVLIGTDVALVSGAQQPKPRPIVQVVKMSGAPAVQPIVYLTVAPEIKPGPDGKLHDAFTVTNFQVHAGQPIKLVINNADSVPHSINSPTAGVNIVAKPGVHSYSLVVSRTGSFEWYCMMPCDPFSMATVGYMRGYITSV